MPLRRQRAELVAHRQPTNRPDHRPERGQKRAAEAPRVGGAARVPDPAVQPRLAGARARRGHDDARLRDGARAIGRTATPHHAHRRDRRRMVPGSGERHRVGRREASLEDGQVKFCSPRCRKRSSRRSVSPRNEATVPA
jgi:hypothetical protein